MFKFIEKNNEFYWENDEIRLKYTKVTNKTNVYYFEIYKKINTSKEWNLISSIATNEFPCLLDIKKIIEKILTLDLKDCGQKCEQRNNETKYIYTLQPEKLAYDDFYSITKNVIYKNHQIIREYYSLYVATSLNNNIDFNTFGIRIDYLKKEDLNQLYECICNFLDTY